MGIIDIQTGERNGKAVGVLQVEQSDRVMLITNAGQVIKIPVANIRECHRNTKGVRCMRVDDNDWIVSMVKVQEDDTPDDDLNETESSGSMDIIEEGDQNSESK